MGDNGPATQDNTDFEQIVRDVAGYVGALTIMTGEEWSKSLTSLSASGVLDINVGDLTRGQREKINMVFDQAGHGDQWADRTIMPIRVRMNYLKTLPTGEVGMGVDNDQSGRAG
jgi:hypothetical protein